MTTYDMFDIPSRISFLKEFVTRKDAFAQQNDNGSYRKVTTGLTDELLIEHEEGTETLGFYQMYNDGKVRWVCYDLDTHGDELPETAMEATMDILDRLVERDIPYLLEASGSDSSYHIWVMLDEVDVFKAYHWSRELISGLEVDCEIFPKQSKPMEYGNLVKLPLAYNRKVSKWSKIINKNKDGSVSVTRVNIDDYEPKELTEVERRTTSTSNFTGVAMAGIKPCMEEAIKECLQMTGTQGHDMRIAMVAELSNMGWSRADICGVFVNQMDYDSNMTMKQIDSVYHYNRWRCSTLRNRCSTFVKCDGCKYQEME